MDGGDGPRFQYRAVGFSLGGGGSAASTPAPKGGSVSAPPTVGAAGGRPLPQALSSLFPGLTKSSAFNQLLLDATKSLGDGLSGNGNGSTNAGGASVRVVAVCVGC